MPVVDSYLNDGDPVVQASGQRRGTINVVFTGGRVITRSIRADDAAAWADLMLNIEAKIEAEVQRSDASSNIQDEDIEASGEASREQRAVAYLREAMGQASAYDAYLLMARFDNFRQARGWSWSQVASGLMAAGLDEDELTAFRTAYQYLTGGGRPAILADAKTIQAQWETR